MKYQDFHYTPPALTPEDIYILEVLDRETPRGYEVAEFRAPRVGETFLNLLGGAQTLDEETSFQFERKLFPNPRFILKKRPLRRVTFEATGEYRPARKGEFYYDGSSVIQWSGPGETVMYHSICRLVEDTEA